MSFLLWYLVVGAAFTLYMFSMKPPKGYEDEWSDMKEAKLREPRFAILFAVVGTLFWLPLIITSRITKE